MRQQVVALAEIIFAELDSVDHGAVKYHDVNVERHHTNAFRLRSPATGSLKLRCESCQGVKVTVKVTAAHSVGIRRSQTGVIVIFIYLRCVKMVEGGSQPGNCFGYCLAFAGHIATYTYYCTQVHFAECRRVITVISGVAPMRAGSATVPVPIFTYRLWPAPSSYIPPHVS